MANVLIEIPDALKADFQKAAIRRGKSMAAIVREAIVRFVEREREKEETPKDD